MLNVDASIWLNIETDYRLYKAREVEAREAADATELKVWLEWK